MATRCHTKTSRSCAQLNYQWLGPFVINRPFRLDLPLQLRIHPVFHNSLLEPY